MEEEIIEEEIITPEEEVFDYQKLRYILDKDGYIYHVSLGALIICDLGECTEYKGEVPEKYETIQEWHDGELERLNAWKIVDGNLVFDETRYKELQALCKIQEEENSCASKKWVKDRLKVSSSVVTDELASSKLGTSLLILNDAGDYEIPELKIESTTANSVNVISSNKNILGISGINSDINGVTITINSDGTIKLNGTATDIIEFDLNGSSTNQEMLYLIQKNTNYAISGLTDNVSLSLYSYDGTDRAYVGNYINQNFNLTESYNITQTILSIPSGAAFENVVISPQIEIGEATDFIKHEETKATGILSENECYIDSLVSYSNKTIIMIDKEVSSIVKYYRYKYLNEKFAEIEINENEVKTTVSKMNETLGQQNTAISQISQTVNEIKSEISDIADVSISADGYGSVYLEKINESEPMYIKIYPSENEDISYLYPSNNLFPSDDLFSNKRILRFENDEYIVDYELPSDLLYYDEINYDEFILDYDNQKCEVNKRVGYNEDGTKCLLETPVTISYEYPSIPLTSGDYTVSMLGYDNAYLFVRLMCENIYTNQFATKVELNSAIIQTKDSITSQVKSEYATKNELVSTKSEIKQTTDSINLEVSKKVNDKDYTSAQILMKINGDTSSTVIKSSKLDVDAIATFTNNKLSKEGSTIINGANITTGTISTARLNSDVITTKNFSAQSINANKISSGTLTGANIHIDNGFGAFRMAKYEHNHPAVSALNVMSYASTPSATGASLSFRSGTYVENLGNQIGYISYGSSGAARYYSSANMNLESGNSFGLDSNGFLRISAGASDLADTGSGSVYVTANNHINLRTKGSVWVQGNGFSSSRVLTDVGSSSSKSVKENIKEFNEEKYDKALTLLKDMKLYDYDYKYDLYKDKKQYGFIIDEIEELDKKQEFFKIEENEAIVNGEHLNFNIDDKKDGDETIKVKKYDPNTLDKYLLTVCKALYEKVEKLEKELEEMKNEKN